MTINNELELVYSRHHLSGPDQLELEFSLAYSLHRNLLPICEGTGQTDNVATFTPAEQMFTRWLDGLHCFHCSLGDMLVDIWLALPAIRECSRTPAAVSDC
jgi:hypothetical protein